MANEKDAQVELMSTKSAALQGTATDMRSKADGHRSVVTGINSSTESDWIGRYTAKFNELVSRIDTAAGEVEKTSGTLGKIREELIKEDTREL